MPIPSDPAYPDQWKYAQVAWEFPDRPLERVETIAILPNQRTDETGDVFEVVDVGFRILGVGGNFYVHPRATNDWPEQALELIAEKQAQVLAIYEGLGSSAEMAPIPSLAP